MSWEEIFINKIVADDKVLSAFGEIFDLSNNEIVIQHEMNDISLVSLQIKLVCSLFQYTGDFPMLIVITPLTKELLPKERLHTLGRLCDLLHVHALLLDFEIKIENGTPYDCTLIKGYKQYQHVKLDPDLMDKDEEPEMRIINYMEYINN